MIRDRCAEDPCAYLSPGRSALSLLENYGCS